MDRTVHMALCREVDDSARPVPRQEIPHALTVGDVRLDKDMAIIALKARQIFQVAGVGQFVEVDHWLANPGEPVQNKVGTDKPGAPGNQNHGKRFC
jgi:hypothetical protein